MVVLLLLLLLVVVVVVVLLLLVVLVLVASSTNGTIMSRVVESKPVNRFCAKGRKVLSRYDSISHSQLTSISRGGPLIGDIMGGRMLWCSWYT